MFRTFILFFLYTSSLDAGKYYYVQHPKYEKCGFFYVLDCTFGMIKNILHYSKDNGFTVDYGTDGLYYDPEMGPNFFTYYFEPIAVGDPTKYWVSKKATGEGFSSLMFNDHRLNNYAFLNRFLKVKPEILAEVDHWVETYFTGYAMIGVHYRGTDKGTEMARLSYDTFIAEVKKELAYVKGEYRLFVASDELEFIEKMDEVFPGKVVYLTDIERSSDGQSIHGNASSPYLAGHSALVDALLLSRCHRIVKTFSNLSRWSGYFNPYIPITEVRPNEILHY